jgi:pimeloyl-ACP methyl ester carboxylesterase
MRQLLMSFVTLLCLAPAVEAETKLTETIAALGAKPCETSELSCVTLKVPLDHRANDPSKTMEITFAVSPATEESKGVLFYFVGGPGGSGLASADDYVASLSEEIPQNIDIVFVDQRGTGPVHGLSCPNAQAVFDSADVSLEKPEAIIATTKAYATDCVTETGATDLLAVVATDQAIRDSELFRQAIGAPKVWLYGESYGTQFVQQYATAFPDAVRGVIVDGVVELNLSSERFYASYIKASESLLSRVLADCATLPSCAEDMQSDAAQIYDDLAGKLAKGPVEVDFVLGDGSVVKRNMTSALLETNAFYALYSPDGRAAFLRSLAAAGRGNMTPMLQLGYSNLYIDPQTEEGIEDPSWFGAAYYAINCTDYGSGEGTPDEQAARILQEAKSFAPNAPRLLRTYYLERMVCAYWPNQGAEKRPEPFAGGDYPTLVLNGDGDPITPISMAYSVMDNAKNSYGVFMKGGPHVIWGRDLACPDVIVSALLIEGTLPEVKEQQCIQDFTSDYAALTLTDPAEQAQPMAVAQAVASELFQSAELSGWYGDHPQSFGCDVAGSFEASPTDRGTAYAFKDCSFWPGLVINGSGEEIDAEDKDDGMVLNLAVSGNHQGEFVYTYRNATEAWGLTGTYDGKPAGITRTLP